MIVNWRMYDVNGVNLFKPTSKDKSYIKYIKCEQYSTCKAFNKTKCVGFEHCPYGSFVKENGYTKKAKASRTWSNSKQELVKDIKQNQKVEKMMEINEYIYFPYSYWSFNAKEERMKPYSRHLFSYDTNFIHKNDFFDIDFLNIVLSRTPPSAMGGPISDYQYKIVPKIISHLKEEFNELYLKLIDKYPKYSIENKEINFVGRKALIKTLVPNIKFKYDKYEAYFNGDQLVIMDYPLSLLFLKDINIVNKQDTFIDFEIDVSNEDFIIISDNKQADKYTKFID